MTLNGISPELWNIFTCMQIVVMIYCNTTKQHEMGQNVSQNFKFVYMRAQTFDICSNMDVKMLLSNRMRDIAFRAKNRLEKCPQISVVFISSQRDRVVQQCTRFLSTPSSGAVLNWWLGVFIFRGMQYSNSVLLLLNYRGIIIVISVSFCHMQLPRYLSCMLSVS